MRNFLKYKTCWLNTEYEVTELNVKFCCYDINILYLRIFEYLISYTDLSHFWLWFYQVYDSMESNKYDKWIMLCLISDGNWLGVAHSVNSVTCTCSCGYIVGGKFYLLSTVGLSNNKQSMKQQKKLVVLGAKHFANLKKYFVTVKWFSIIKYLINE